MLIVALTAQCGMDSDAYFGRVGAPTPKPVCGDGKVAEGEECDGKSFGTATCKDYGFVEPSGLVCRENCTLDASSCGPTCGNNTVEPGEECDGNALNGKSCKDDGFSNAAGLACSACHIDKAGCKPTCGDGKIELGETCDASDLGGKSCTDYGYATASGLACTKTCTGYDPSGCEAKCNGVFEKGEVCDGEHLDGKTCEAFGFVNPAGLVCKACEVDASGCKAVCANNVIEPGEECDDGDAKSDDGCSATCKLEGTTCDSAIPVTLSMGTKVFHGSTTSGGKHEVDLCGSDGPDRVYAVTPTKSGVLTARVLRDKTGFDSVLYAMTKCDDKATTVGCANSYDTGIPPNALYGGEVLSMNVVAKKTYFVVVDGFQVTDQGNYETEFNLSSGSSCDDAVPIKVEAGSAMTLIGSTVGNVKSAQGSCGGNGAGNVIYAIERATAGKVSVGFDAGGTFFKALAYARTKCDKFNTEFSCEKFNNQTGGDLIDVDLKAGERAYVFVDGANGDEGVYALTIEPK